MNCPNCGSQMLALFTSHVCESCERIRKGEFTGFVVWKDTDRILNYCLFPAYEDAFKWKEINDIQDAHVTEVVLCSKPTFKQSTGILKDIEIADTLYEIYPDGNFEHKKHRGFVHPEERDERS